MTPGSRMARAMGLPLEGSSSLPFWPAGAVVTMLSWAVTPAVGEVVAVICRLAGVKVQLAPTGRPEQERVMKPVKALTGRRVRVEFPLLPAFMESDAGVMARLKSGLPAAMG